MPNTILLKGDLGRRYEEGRAAGTIKPGMLIETDGDAKLVAHATSGGPAAKMVAIEDGLIGRTIDDNYVTDELVRYIFLASGEEVYMILKAGQNADEDDFLASNGDGKLKVLAGADVPLFRCVEAVNAVADSRVKVTVV